MKKTAQTSNLQKCLLHLSPITSQFLDFMVFELLFIAWQCQPRIAARRFAWNNTSVQKRFGWFIVNSVFLWVWKYLITENVARHQIFPVKYPKLGKYTVYLKFVYRKILRWELTALLWYLWLTVIASLYNSECPIGRYGFDCLNHCTCANSSLCDPKTGWCECQSGKTGPECRLGDYLL